MCLFAYTYLVSTVAGDEAVNSTVCPTPITIGSSCDAVLLLCNCTMLFTTIDMYVYMYVRIYVRMYIYLQGVRTYTYVDTTILIFLEMSVYNLLLYAYVLGQVKFRGRKSLSSPPTHLSPMIFR